MMIFVTIGGQEPFDRLIEAVDNIALTFPEYEIVAQVLNSEYQAKNIKTISYLSPKEFDFYFNQASLIIGHAGMGTILTALQREKPIIVLPRRIDLHEHRNDHQMATAKKMAELNYVHVIYEAQDLTKAIRNLALESLHKIGDKASSTLIDSIREFIS